MTDDGRALPFLDAEADDLLRRHWSGLPFYAGLVEMDAEGEIIFLCANAANAAALRVPPEEIPGLRLSTRIAPDTIQLWRDAYQKALDTREVVELDAYFGRDRKQFVSISITYLGHSAAGVPRFGYTYRDITALRQPEELLRSILASTPGYFLVLDRDLNIVSFSGPVSAESKQILGRNALALGAPEQADAIRAVLGQVLRAGEIVQFEFKSPSEPIWYSLSIGPLRRGAEIDGLTVVGTDITARKLLELELFAKNGDLEREIEERRRAEALLLEQQDQILALSTPILKVWEGVLALPIIGALDAARAARVMEALLHDIARDRARVAILDLTGVDAVDAETAGHLLRIARAITLLGSRCLVSGISPRIARTMTSIGIGAEGFATFGTLEDALRHAFEHAGIGRRSARSA